MMVVDRVMKIHKISKKINKYVYKQTYPFGKQGSMTWGMSLSDEFFSEDIDNRIFFKQIKTLGLVACGDWEPNVLPSTPKSWDEWYTANDIMLEDILFEDKNDFDLKIALKKTEERNAYLRKTESVK